MLRLLLTFETEELIAVSSTTSLTRSNTLRAEASLQAPRFPNPLESWVAVSSRKNKKTFRTTQNALWLYGRQAKQAASGRRRVTPFSSSNMHITPQTIFHANFAPAVLASITRTRSNRKALHLSEDVAEHTREAPLPLRVRKLHVRALRVRNGIRDGRE